MAFALLVVECVVYGIVLIRIIQSIFTKEFLARIKKLNPLFYITALFFILCAISVNEAIWPIFFGIYFISLFLSPGDEKDDEKIFVSLSDALIISFFAIQSFAFLHRPYDQVRYVGAFSNSNVNGMFYICVYFGWLGKLSFLEKNEGKKFLRVIHFLFACAMWSFALLTISRSTLIAFIMTTILFLITNEVVIMKKKFLKGFLLKGICMFCVFALSFPIVFICVRYIPALRHHPIWITEYKEEFVHSYDPWNSEKYTEIDEFYNAFIGRFDPEDIDDRGAVITKEQVPLDKHNAGPDAVETPEEPQGEYIVEDGAVISYPDGVMPGADPEHPAYEYETYEGIEKILGIRKYIFGYYFRFLNLSGHEPEYPTAYLHPWYMVPHAHNSYLQIAYCFGIVQGIMFAAISLFAFLFPVVYVFVKKDKAPWHFGITAMWEFGIILISMTENLAFPGKMLFSVLFLSLLPLMCVGKKSEQ